SNSSGQCVLDVGSAGTYNVTIDISGLWSRTLSRTVVCNGTTTLPFGDIITLHLTDSDRTITLTETSALSSIWRGCYQLSQTNYAPDFNLNPAGACDNGSTITTGNQDIKYQLSCGGTDGAPPGGWKLTRNWGACCWSLVFNTSPFTAVYSASNT